MSNRCAAKIDGVSATRWNTPVDGNVLFARDCKDHDAVRSTTYMEVFEVIGTPGCSRSEPYWSWEVVGIIESKIGKVIVCPGDWVISIGGGIYYPVSNEIFVNEYERED